MLTTPHPDNYSTTDPNWKSYQLSKAEIEFNMMEEINVASHMRMCTEKTTFLGKDDLASIMYYAYACIIYLCQASCITKCFPPPPPP